MSASTIGLILGVLVGAVNAAILLRFAAARPVLKAVALADLVIMPVIGWTVGAYVFEGAL